MKIKIDATPQEILLIQDIENCISLANQYGVTVTREGIKTLMGMGLDVKRIIEALGNLYAKNEVNFGELKVFNQSGKLCRKGSDWKKRVNNLTNLKNG